MSNERFDRLMRKNLEAVRPTYQPHAWSRFRKRLPITGLGPWLLQYGGWLLSGLMLAGWLTTLYVLQNNQELIRQLNTKLSKVTPPSTAITTSKQVFAPAPPDTVYVVKRTIVEHRYVPQPAPSTVDDRGSTSKIAISQTTSEIPKLQQVGAPDSTDATLPALSTEPAIVHPDGTKAAVRADYAAKRDKQQSTTKRFPDQKTQRVAFDQLPPASVTAHQTTSPIDDRGHKPVLAKTDSSATVTSPLTKPVTSESSQSLSHATADVTTTNSLPKTDSLAQHAVTQAQSENPASESNPKVAQPIQKAPEGPKQSRPSFHLSSIKPRLGLEATRAVNGVGVGPMFEVFPMDNLGLSIGLQASALFAGNHHELRDFNSATGQQFIDQYKAYLPAQYDQIRDISIQTSLISIPVSLNYYVPLRRQWSLLLHTGTRFDLAGYQEVRYESYWRGEDQHHSFETNTRMPFFHNFMFGTGLQYRRSRVAAQLSPYFLYDFRNRDNTPTHRQFGVKASLWLNLFK